MVKRKFFYHAVLFRTRSTATLGVKKKIKTFLKRLSSTLKGVYLVALKPVY